MEEISQRTYMRVSIAHGHSNMVKAGGGEACWRGERDGEVGDICNSINIKK